MSKIYLLNYNNYYNRIFRAYLNFSDYSNHALYSFDNVNFDSGDGITTTLVVNSAAEADYLIETVINSSGDELVNSRWFILESKFMRKDQYRLTLRRDVLADAYAKGIGLPQATVFAERGYVPNTSSLIYNSEGNSYNQIKKSETLIKDESKSAWLIGYLAPNVFADGDITINVSSNVDIAYDYTYANTDVMLQNNRYTSLSPSNTVDLDPNVEFMSFDSTRTAVLKDIWYIKYEFGYIDSTLTDNAAPFPTLQIPPANISEAQMYFSENLLGDQYRVAIQDAIKLDNEATMPSTADMADLLSKENKIARVGTASTGYTYYKLIITPQSEATRQVVITSGATKTYIDSRILPMINQGIASGSMPEKYNIRYTSSNYTVYWQKMTILQNQITLNQDAPVVDKSPYYCFAIPYNSIAIQKGSLMTNTSASLSRQLARQIATQLSSFCYDVQLLPYFPLQSYISNTATIDITEMSTKQYASLSQGEAGGITSILFWINEPNFSFTIEDSIVYNSQEPKIQNETQFCRLNSPNYAASFDFSVAKNKGVGYWQVDCSYKPYQPYIHVAPNWKGLYCSNFNDARGLICTGDFSIDLMSDKWQEYQINNKNYQEIFNRQIQTLDLQQRIASRNEIWNAVAGGVQGAATGAAGGALAGGIYGAAAGAIIGGAASTVGAVMDIDNNRQLRADARSSALDLFNYNIGNVKSLPNTLTKVSTFNINNKIFPFYEIYEATSEEIGALRRRLEYRGYNLGIVGTLSDYWVKDKYFKGKLIRLEAVPDSTLGDSHFVECINSELMSGIYWDSVL